MAEMENIVLELDREHYPMVLRQYGLEGAKEQAISMALAQYAERPLTAAMLYTCLSVLESDLARLFPQPKTAEERAEEAAEEAEEEAYYQAETAKMRPYRVNGSRLYVNADGNEAEEGEDSFPVWETAGGSLTARIYLEGWDWISLDRSNWEEEDEERE